MSALPGKLRAEHAQPRWPNDWYVEPPEAVHSLFDHIRFVGSVHDPACGAGNIPKVAWQRGILATGADLIDRGFGEVGIDYLRDHRLRPNIVTNPPYKLAEEFVHHALVMTSDKIAVLVRLPFLAGQRRAKELFTTIPPATVLVLSKRPSMPPGGTEIPASGGTTDYCWIVWDHDHDGPTRLVWSGDRSQPPKRRRIKCLPPTSATATPPRLRSFRRRQRARYCARRRTASRANSMNSSTRAPF